MKMGRRSNRDVSMTFWLVILLLALNNNLIFIRGRPDHFGSYQGDAAAKKRAFIPDGGRSTNNTIASSASSTSLLPTLSFQPSSRPSLRPSTSPLYSSTPTNSPSSIPSSAPSDLPTPPLINFKTPNLGVTKPGSPIIFEGCKQISLTVDSVELQKGQAITISITSSRDTSYEELGTLALAPSFDDFDNNNNNHGLTLLSSSSSSLTFKGRNNAINTVLDGMTYTNSHPGRYNFNILLTTSGDEEESTTTTTTLLLSTFTIAVNAMFDVTKAKHQIMDGVEQIHTSKYPGRMFTFEETSHAIAMYPSTTSSNSNPYTNNDGPLVTAATLGKGRIVAVPHHEMLTVYNQMTTNNHFYKNVIEWLSSSGSTSTTTATTTASTTNPDSVLIITYDQGIATWLITEAGYFNVIYLADESQLIPALKEVGDDDGIKTGIFIGWMGISEPKENIEALQNFCANNGGGLFIAEYGIGYEFWCWGQDEEGCRIPGNVLLREAGIGFRGGTSSTNQQSQSGQEDNNNGPGAIMISNNIAQSDDCVEGTSDNVQTQTTSTNIVLEMLEDSSSFTLQEFYDGWYTMGGIFDTFDDDDYIICELYEVFQQRVSTINPTPSHPVSNPIEKLLLYQEALAIQRTPPQDIVLHRTAEEVYGAIPQDAPRVINRTVDIDTSRGRWHPTGLYVAPGDVVTIQVPQALVGKGYYIRINANTDNVDRRDSWERFPYVHRYYAIKDSTSIEVGNAFGGAIFVDLGGVNNRYMPPNIGIQSITVTNAIEHPYFILDKHTDEEWMTTLRHKPAPYAVFVCPGLIVVQRAEESISLKEPTRIMEWWQQVVELQDDLAGYKDFTLGIADRTAAELVNVDIQINRGAAHAGYPIQAYDKHWGNLMDVDRLIAHGSWGDFHEIGHNHQRGWWTFPNDGEVTVNIFSVYCSRMLIGPNMASGWKWVNDPIQVMREAQKSIQSNSTYTEKENRLPFWIQLVDGFGWDTMKSVLIGYEADRMLDDSTLLPSDEQEKKDQWLVRYSKMAKHNLSKFMKDIWGLEISDSAKKEVEALGLPSWMPAMGGMTSIDVEPNQVARFDLFGETLTMDGMATVELVSQGINGTVSRNQDGTYSYIPNQDFQGTDSFQYSVTSSSGHSRITNVEVTIASMITDPDSTNGAVAQVEDGEFNSMEPPPEIAPQDPQNEFEDKIDNPLRSNLAGWKGLFLFGIVVVLFVTVSCVLSRIVLVLAQKRKSIQLSKKRYQVQSESNCLASSCTSMDSLSFGNKESNSVAFDESEIQEVGIDLLLHN